MASSSNISTLDVSNATSRLTVEETRQLVFHMGVPLRVLDDIADEYKGENRKQHFVQKWLDMIPNATWDKLVAGLRKISLNTLATEIEFKHLSKVAVPSGASPSLLSTSSSVCVPSPVSTPGYLETATPVPIDFLPPAPLTSTPAPLGSLSPAPLTANSAPVGSLSPAPLTATPAPVGSLPPASLTSTPAPLGSLPSAPLTATPAPVGSLPSAPQTATPAPVGSLPPASLTSTPAPVGSLPPASLTSTPAPLGSLPSAPLTATPAPVVFEQRVEETRDKIEYFEGEFSDLKYEAQKALLQKQDKNPEFFQRFQNHLLDVPVTKKQIHILFFTRNEDEILNAKNIQKLFAILSRYCNYSNYEIIFHIVKRFCHHELKGRMLKYRDFLTIFEKFTTVDVYLCSISALPGGEIREGFARMTMKINKPPSQCTLYELRVLKESIEEKATLQSYAMYIEAPGEGSVCVRLLVPWEVHYLVYEVLTPEFREEHLLTEVMIKRWAVKKYYLVRTWNL